MTLDQLLWECFRHFVHLDESNAAMHCALVRYSPITFRLAEALDERGSVVIVADYQLLEEVINHRGQYAEDTGR